MFVEPLPGPGTPGLTSVEPTIRPAQLRENIRKPREPNLPPVILGHRGYRATVNQVINAANERASV